MKRLNVDFSIKIISVVGSELMQNSTSISNSIIIHKPYFQHAKTM